MEVIAVEYVCLSLVEVLLYYILPSLYCPRVRPTLLFYFQDNSKDAESADLPADLPDEAQERSPKRQKLS